MRFIRPWAYNVASDGSDEVILEVSVPLVWLWLLLLIFLPGYMLLAMGQRGGVAGWWRWLAAPGASLSLFPLALLWAHILGIRFNALIAWLALGLCGLCMAVARLRGREHLWRLLSAFIQIKSVFLRKNRQNSVKFASLFLYLFLFIYIFALSLGSRLAAIQGLAAPLYWDSVHHTLIAQLLVDNGGLFSSWQPYLPLGSLTYHFGFHALVAWFHWLSGMDMPQAVLFLGQVLNACTVLVAYLLAQHLTGRPWAGFIAAFITGLISLMPAYYVNWGRYTQLAGQVILPVLMALTMETVAPGEIDAGHGRAGATTGMAPPWTPLLITTVLAAGLALTHYRVFIFYGAFVLALLLVLAYESRQTPRLFLRGAGHLGLVALGALALVAPWAWNLLQNAVPIYMARYTTPLTPQQAEWLAAYNSLRDVDKILPPYLLWPAIAGLAWGLWRRERWAFLLLLWVEGLFLAANPQWLGLPGMGLISNHAVLIGLYIPVSVAIGFLGASILEQLLPWQAIGEALLVAVIVLGGLWGAQQVAGIVNPYFVMVTPADLQAMAWIRENTPPQARFLVNSEPAYGGSTVVGTDAGWWLPLLARRQSTVPPLIASSERPEEDGYSQQARRLAEIVRKNSLEDKTTLQALRAAGVTHIYIGAKGGHLKAEDLIRLPFYRALYQKDGVWVFAIEYDPRPFAAQP